MLNFGRLIWASQSFIWANQGRSGHCATVRKHHLEQFPKCAACGGSKKLSVHHIKPYHLYPDLELNPSNLITLCEKSEVLGCNCHFVYGHFGDWTAYNPKVIETAEEFFLRLHKKTYVKLETRP